MPSGWNSGEHEPISPRKWRDHNPRNAMEPQRGGGSGGGGGGKGSQKSGCFLTTLMALGALVAVIAALLS